VNANGANGGGGLANRIEEVPPGVIPLRSSEGRPFMIDRVVPIPGWRTAAFVVWCDNAPYAGFHDRETAYEAMAAWRQRWPAAQGHDFTLQAR
jgi:hypothetical protein